jgi:hypothetical protein
MPHEQLHGECLAIAAQITLMQIDLLRAAAQPLTPEEARLPVSSINQAIRKYS